MKSRHICYAGMTQYGVLHDTNKVELFLRAPISTERKRFYNKSVRTLRILIAVVSQIIIAGDIQFVYSFVYTD